MTRANFIKIIKLRSCWRIDKRKGNYTLPNGEHLSTYIDELVRGQMELDGITGITSDGNLAMCAITGLDESSLPIYTVMPAFQENEIVSYDEMTRRIKRLVNEIIY